MKLVGASPKKMCSCLRFPVKRRAAVVKSGCQKSVFSKSLNYRKEVTLDKSLSWKNHEVYLFVQYKITVNYRTQWRSIWWGAPLELLGPHIRTSVLLFKKNKGRKALRQSNNVFKDFASFHFKGEFVCRQWTYHSTLNQMIWLVGY